jgi:hypothetical protein
MEEYFAYHKKPHAKYMTVAQYNAQFNTDFPVDEEYDNAFKEAYTQARKAAGPDEFIKHIGMDHVQMVKFFEDDVAEDSATRQRVVVTESSNNVKGGFMTKYRELDETGVPVGEEFTASKTESGKFRKVFKYESGEEMKEGDIVIRKYADGRNERGRISKITKQEIKLIFDDGTPGRAIDSENSRASQLLTLIERAETPGGTGRATGSVLPSETPLQPETPGGGGDRRATSVPENSRRVQRTQEPEGGGGRRPTSESEYTRRVERHPRRGAGGEGGGSNRRLQFEQPVTPSAPQTPQAGNRPDGENLLFGEDLWGSQTPQSETNEDYQRLVEAFETQGKLLEEATAQNARYEMQMNQRIQELMRDNRRKDREIEQLAALQRQLEASAEKQRQTERLGATSNNRLNDQVAGLRRTIADQNSFIQELKTESESESARLTTENSSLLEQVANLQSQQGNTFPLSHNQNAQQIFGQILSQFRDQQTVYANVSEALQTAYRSIPQGERDAFLAYLSSDFGNVYDEYTRTATV